MKRKPRVSTVLFLLLLLIGLGVLLYPTASDLLAPQVLAAYLRAQA